MKAQPAPIVSGKYFFPNAPLLCLKRMPACADTSVNSIAPVGLGGVGLAEGDGEAAAISFWGATVDGAGCFLQDKSSKANVTSNKKVEIVRISIWIRFK